MDLHGEIMNITVEKRKQNMAIDEAIKNNKNLKDILVAVYTRGHRDARHAAAEKAAQQGVQRTCFNCGGPVNVSTGYIICERGCGGPVASR